MYRVFGGTRRGLNVGAVSRLLAAAVKLNLVVQPHCGVPRRHAFHAGLTPTPAPLEPVTAVGADPVLGTEPATPRGLDYCLPEPPWHRLRGLRSETASRTVWSAGNTQCFPVGASREARTTQSIAAQHTRGSSRICDFAFSSGRVKAG